MPWAVAAAAVGVAGSAYSAKQGRDAAKDARRDNNQATQEAIERGQEAFSTTEQNLAPFMGQERASSNQLMAQMGMAPPQGGWGSDIETSGSGSSPGSMDRFLQDLMANETAIALRAGYKGKHGIRGVNEGARRAEQFLNTLKKNGKIPADYEIPQLQDLVEIGQTAMQAHGGYKALAQSNVADGKKHGGENGYSMADVESLASKYFDPETGADLSVMEAEAAAAEGGDPGSPGGGPQVQTAEMILERMGVEGLDPELRDQYMGEVMRMAESDPELASYLGLTEESAQVGDSYQQGPAYMRAMEQGREQVLQSGAGAGHLYSGRRGEEVSRMAHDVEGQYYDRAQGERDLMMQRRQGQRGAEMGFMGTEVNAARARQSDAYNNYMSMLSSMSQPTTTTNVGSMRQNAAAGQGNALIQGAQNSGQYRMDSAATTSAAIADVSGGLMQMGNAWLDRDK